MRHLSLESLKKAIVESVKTKDEDELRSIYYDTSSIDDIFSGDVIQSVLSYLPHQKSTKSVKKLFKKLTETNNVLSKRSREQMISSQFNGKNEWHLHKNQLQKNKEPEIFVDSLEDVFDLMEDGDKLFIYEGHYEMVNITRTDYYDFGSKAIKIEGIGQCTLTARCGDQLEIDIKSKLSIKNVSFEKITFSVGYNGSLYLTNCTLAEWACTEALTNGKMDCFQCHFAGDPNAETKGAIYASGLCELSVIDCTFDYCIGGNGDHMIHLFGKTDQIRLILIGNKFKNMFESPINRKTNEQAIIRYNEMNCDTKDTYMISCLNKKIDN